MSRPLTLLSKEISFVMTVFTIGHSNHSIETFIALLQQHAITALADVRSHPYSRYLTHFNQTPLKQALAEVGIRYVFLGQELGARPKDPSCYVEGKALYNRIAATSAFVAGLERVITGAETYTIALMCAEKDPIVCHRAILVCPRLHQQSMPIQHILNDGQLESHAQLEERLLIQYRMGDILQQQLSLFDLTDPGEPIPQSRSDRLQKAYELQGEKIAYVEQDGNHE